MINSTLGYSLKSHIITVVISFELRIILLQLILTTPLVFFPILKEEAEKNQYLNHGHTN